MPLDWVHPRGRMITLAVIRHLAGNAKQRIGTLFINPGGPGDTGVGLVRAIPRESTPLAVAASMSSAGILAGTNASTRVRCFRSHRAETKFWAGASIPTTSRASQRFRRKIAALAGRCGRVSGWLLPHISTADTARDLDYLRRLVGERHLTYVGLSYGTYLGQTYANMFPGRVRAMLLDGVVDPVPTRSRPRRGLPARLEGATKCLTGSSRSVRVPGGIAAHSPAVRAPRPKRLNSCSRG